MIIGSCEGIKTEYMGVVVFVETVMGYSDT